MRFFKLDLFMVSYCYITSRLLYVIYVAVAGRAKGPPRSSFSIHGTGSILSAVPSSTLPVWLLISCFLFSSSLCFVSPRDHQGLLPAKRRPTTAAASRRPPVSTPQRHQQQQWFHSSSPRTVATNNLIDFGFNFAS